MFSRTLLPLMDGAGNPAWVSGDEQQRVTWPGRWHHRRGHHLRVRGDPLLLRAGATSVLVTSGTHPGTDR